MLSRMQLDLATALLSIVSVLAASPAPAHHSFAAYEDTRVRRLEGTITTFRWTNPHVTLTILVKREDRDERQQWLIVTSDPAILMRFGWRQNSLKSGDRVSVLCNPLRDGSPRCRLHTLTLLDTGQTLKTKLSAATDLVP